MPKALNLSQSSWCSFRSQLWVFDNRNFQNYDIIVVGRTPVLPNPNNQRAKLNLWHKSVWLQKDYRLEKYLEGLNPQQRSAITYGNGPLLIVAGAGTGKTNTLAFRVSYLLSQKISPEKIWCWRSHAGRPKRCLKGQRPLLRWTHHLPAGCGVAPSIP